MFASRVTKVVTTPSDPSYDVTIRRLSGRKLEKAQRETLFEGADLLRKIGGVAIMKEIQSLGGEDAVRQQARQERERDPMRAYEPISILEAGIVNWKVTGSDDDPATPTTTQLEDLEDDSLKFLMREILVLSRVKFDDPSERVVEEETKND